MLVIDGHDKWRVEKMLSYTQHYKGSQSEVPSMEHWHLLGPTESETLGQGPPTPRDSDTCTSERTTLAFTF